MANPKRKPLKILQCPCCGTEFQPVNGNQVNCSRACRQRFYDQRNRTKISDYLRSWQAARRQYVNADELKACQEDPRKARTIAGPDVIVCLECGAKLKRLGDHVKLHGMTAAEYKRKPALGRQIPRYGIRSSLSSTNLHDSRSQKAKSLRLADQLAGYFGPPSQRLIQSRSPHGPWKMSLEGRLNQRDTNPRKGKGRPDLWRITSEGQVVTDALIAQWRLKGMKGKDIAQHVGIKTDRCVGFFSLEMSKEQLFMRMLTAEAEVDSHRFRGGFLNERDYAQLSASLGRLSEARVFIDDTAGLGVLEMRAKARRLKAEHGLDLLVVDYLQLMQGRGRFENRTQELASISRALKGIAKELSIPVIALSQLSRAPESRSDRRPQLADLRESGALEQDADVVMFIFREEQYDPTPENENLAEVIVGKQRNGPTGTVKLAFLKQFTRFANLSPAQE